MVIHPVPEQMAGIAYWVTSSILAQVLLLESKGIKAPGKKSQAEAPGVSSHYQTGK